LVLVNVGESAFQKKGERGLGGDFKREFGEKGNHKKPILAMRGLKRAIISAKVE